MWSSQVFPQTMLQLHRLPIYFFPLCFPHMKCFSSVFFLWISDSLCSVEMISPWRRWDTAWIMHHEEHVPSGININSTTYTKNTLCVHHALHVCHMLIGNDTWKFKTAQCHRALFWKFLTYTSSVLSLGYLTCVPLPVWPATFLCVTP